MASQTPQETPAPAEDLEPAAESTRFFSVTDWAAFGTASVAAFAWYLYTLAPTVTLEDSGELVVASRYLGVPHPPGYPIWTILSWFFQWVFSFVPYRGYPNPAWGVNLMSAFFGALAAGITAMLVSSSAAAMLDHMQEVVRSLDRTTKALICWGAAVACGLLFAFTPGSWSQSVIAEVYSLNSFFLALILLLTYMWMRRPDHVGYLFVAAFVFGLGMTNHQTLGVILLALGVALLLRDLSLFRDMALVGSVFLVGLTLQRLGDTPRVAQLTLEPADGVFYGVVFLVLMLLCFLISIRWREETVTVVLVLILLGCLGIFALKTMRLPPIKALNDTVPWRLYALALVGQLGIVWVLAFFLPKGRTFAAVVTVVELMLVVLLGRGALHGLVHPTSPWFYFYLIVLNFLVLALAYFLLPKGKTVALVVLLAELGLAFYLYLPIASEQNPPMNWGYPRTWDGFKHAISRGQYEKISPAQVVSSLFLEQIGTYLRDLRVQFTLMVALVGFLPFTAWRIKAGNLRIKAFYVALALALVACFFIGVEELGETGAETGGGGDGIVTVYKSLTGLVIILLGLGFLAALIRELWDLARKLGDNQGTPLHEKITIGVVLVLAAMVFLAGSVFLVAKLMDREVDIPAPQKVFLISVVLGLWFVAAGLAWLLRAGLFEMETDRAAEKWLLVTVAAFVALSFVLVVFINPKQDIQSQFINRVFFIQSHGVYALWIGYGIVLALAFIHALLKVDALTRAMAILTAVVAPMLPIWTNQTNESLIRTIGGAEQNGHSFGWQFGHYQLCGAKAITEELAPGEDPLPNPAFPPEMEPNAVFFGGTDPGRFVPTYQIYCPQDRPDVFLITQNALADNTYMGVMRDLYGDQIWIPSVRDSNNAFKEYVEDVKAGRIPPSADVKIQDGRVSVQGVQGVMRINGILAKMIFEHNKHRHAFYVEESYVIDWMYPYLTPHGLIMKINAEELPELPAEIVNNDRAFWDWYVKRLTGDEEFNRDVVARKTFSKLRGAIAGLYVFRGMYREAEQAFQQARDLYPLSPEANFRLADLYMRERRYPDAEKLIRAFIVSDPLNDKAVGFYDQITNTAAVHERRREIETELLSKGKANIEKVLELAEIYRKTNRKQKFFGLTQNMLNSTGTPPQVYLQIARMYAAERRPDLLSIALRRYLTRVPYDANVWRDLAAISIVLNRPDDAIKALEKAVEFGGDALRKELPADKRFESLRARADFRRLVGAQG
ncbi:MAG: DUF2723 domain-containing protein [Kiritimatiellae bacterium]|nr:DUF2723 domain-containing protein [Kiritimatiellia bacterium]